MRFVSFFLDLELFAKIKEDLASTYSQKLGLLITKDPKHNEKFVRTFLQTLVKKKRVQNFRRKYEILW